MKQKISFYLWLTGLSAFSVHATEFSIMDGSNGGPYVVPGGKHTITTFTGVSSKKFEVKLTVNCTHPGDYISCSGVIFDNGSATIITPITFQGSCDGSAIYSATLNTDSTSCIKDKEYNLNFYCINLTTYTATVPANANTRNPITDCVA